MISDEDIMGFIKDGSVNLTYTFLPGETGQFARQPRALNARQDDAAIAFLNDHMMRSRLALTLGPLVKPVSRTHPVRRTQRFAGHSRIVDLRTCDDGWALRPAQSALVCTNEHLTLSHDIGAYIVGRVSSYNNGLVTVTSFLDSGWNGIIKLLLLNVSHQPVHLHLGFEVGRLFLEHTPDASRDVSAVGTQSVHYGLSWPRILDDRIDPFPQSPVRNRPSARVAAETVNNLLRRYAGVGLVALVFTGTVAASQVYADVRNALEQEAEIATLRERTAQIESRLPISGTDQITVPQGRRRGDVQVTLTDTLTDSVGYRGARSTATVTVLSGPSGTTASASVEQQNDGRVLLRMAARTDSRRIQDTPISVHWTYIP